MNNKGFTLIELLVAVTIIAALSIIGLATYSSVQKNQRDYKRREDINKIMQALEFYRTDMHSYPINGTDFKLGVNSKPLVGTSTTYLDPAPDDPRAGDLNQHYCYRGLKTTGVNCTNNSSSNDFCASYVVCAKMEANNSATVPTACEECVCDLDDLANGGCNSVYASK